MAHCITANDGLVLAGKPAWHGLGVVLPERCSALDALNWANMDWTVEAIPTVGTTSTGKTVNSGDQRLLVREDTGEVFGSCTDGYRPVQNRTLAELADDISRGSSHCIESAGSILAGRKVWFLLDAGEVVAASDDRSKAFFFIGSSHDGSMPITMGLTVTRVVCKNTMTMALGEMGESAMRIRHTRTVSQRLAAAADYLKGAKSALDGYSQAVRQMAETPMDQEQMQAYFTSVWQRVNGRLNPTAAGNKPSRREGRFVTEVAGWVDNFRNHRFQTGLSTAGTVWAALNSVTQWVNHDRTVREEARDASRRTDAVMFGSGAEVQRAAYDAAVALLA